MGELASVKKPSQTTAPGAEAAPRVPTASGAPSRARCQADARKALEPRNQPGYAAQRAELLPPASKRQPIAMTRSSKDDGGFMGTHAAAMEVLGPVTSCGEPGDNLDFLEHFPEGGEVEVVTGLGTTERMAAEAARPGRGKSTVLRLPDGRYHLAAQRGSSEGKGEWWPEPVTRAEVRALHPEASEAFITAVVETNVEANEFLVKRALEGVGPLQAWAEFRERGRWKLINMLTVTTMSVASAHLAEDPTHLSTFIEMADIAMNHFAETLGVR